MWPENDNEIWTEMEKLSKVKDLKPERERNSLKRMNMQDARVWFRYRCKITAHIKGNKSSMYKDNIFDYVTPGKMQHKNTWKVVA